MGSPHQGKEFQEFTVWRSKAKSKVLVPSECISVWTDICGFGNLLAESNWNLNNLQNNGSIELLNILHSTAGRPLLTNPDPLPNDKIIVLNDGIARTIDFTHKKSLDGYMFLFFLRDLLTTHYNLLHITAERNLGVRTILAGGERIQYSPASTTGHSVLFYNEGNLSPFGEAMLNTRFVYNPLEFQMNTAFAKAFTIDSYGSKAGIKINGLYIEKSFLSTLKGIKHLTVKIKDANILFYYKRKLVFELLISETINLNLKGLTVDVYHISRFFIHKQFDGDDVEFILFPPSKN